MFVISDEQWTAGLPDPDRLYILSAVLRNNHDNKGAAPIRILKENVESLIKGRYPASVPELGRHLLSRLSLRTAHLGANIELFGDEDYPIAYCRNPEELDFILTYLRNRGWVAYATTAGPRYDIEITPEGWEELENFHATDVTNPRAFVAMSFSKDLESVFLEGIDPAISECGYRAVRVDREHFLNKIDDEIIAQIRQSRFVVADFTEHRAGVYFEAGFSQGLSIPVIWACRDTDKDDLHFDTRQFPHIIWKDGADLREQLRRRILALLGRGPLSSYKELA